MLWYPAPRALATRALQIASVLGDVTPVRHLAAVSRRRVPELLTDLQEAYRARLLDEHRDAVVFRHQLVQEAIYQDLPRATRQALHREAAGVLAGIDADLSQIASHLLQGANRGDLEEWALNQVGGEVTLCRSCFG